jgi:TamB, inner membrane protein subunit of TAM complex
LKRLVRVVKKSILWLIGSILALIFLAFVLIQVPSVQQYIKDKAVHFLQNKIKTKVEIGRLSFDFPKILVLEDVYFEDQHQDTLLAGDTLIVDISLFALFNNVVEINLIDLRGITVKVSKNHTDSLYNFDYILKAFMSGGDNAPPYDSSAAMRFSIDEVYLDRIRISYADEMNGNDLDLYLRHLDTKIKEFDVDQMRFGIPELTIEGLNITLLQTKAISQEIQVTDTSDVEPAYTYPDLKMGTVDLSNCKVNYINSVSAIDTKMDLGHLRVEFNDLDLRGQKINIREMLIGDFTGVFALGKSAQQAVESTAEEVTIIAETGWNVQLTTLNIENTNFKFDDLTLKKQKKGFDYNHIDIHSLQATLSDLTYEPDTSKGRIEQLSLRESSGLEIKKLQTDFFYSENKAYLQRLLIETPGSLIRDQIQFTYPSLEVFTSDMGLIGIDATILNSTVSFKDILLFAPFLDTMDLFQKYPDGIVRINGSVYGTVKDLVIPSLELSGLGKLHVKASGRIKGLPEMATSFFDVRIDDFTARKEELGLFFPAGTFPDQINLPDQMQISGLFKGTFNDFDIDMKLNSTFGTAFIDGSLKDASKSGMEVYDMDIETESFEIGKLTGMEETLGALTISVSATGQGFDPETAEVVFKGEIDKIAYNGYTYQNLDFDGKSDNGMIEAVAFMKDPNLAFDLDVTANLFSSYPVLNFVLTIDSMKLQKLGFYKEDLQFSGRIVADLETADPDYLNGNIILSRSQISLNGERYRLDTVSIHSSATDGPDTLHVRSEFLTASMYGQYKLTQIADALLDNVNTYFNTSPDSVTISAYDPQQFVFEAYLTRSPLIVQVLPDLKDMADMHLKGNFDSSTGEIFMEGGISMLQYQDYNINNLRLEVKTSLEALNYQLSFDQLSSSRLQILNTSLSGKAQNDKLDLLLKVKDIDDRDQYRIGGTLVVVDQLTEFKLDPDVLLLNHDPWKVAEGNSIRFSSNGILAHDFALSNNGQSLTINSTPRIINAPLDIQFHNFSIETLSRLISRDSLLLGGNINGDATVMHVQTSPVFTADLTIDNFAFRGDTVGNILLNVNNETQDRYYAKMAITGRENEVNLSGYYADTGENSHFDFDIDIAKLNLNTIEGFTYDQIRDASGSIDGNLRVTGTMSLPSIRGDLHFSAAEFNVAQFNAYFRFPDEQLLFTEDGMVFRQFYILDHTGNEALVDGTIFTRDFRDYRFALTANTDDFQVLNSTREDNDLYYGKLFVDARMKIGGSLENPVIDGRIKVKDKTVLTIVVPQSESGIEEREGIVEFVDMDDPAFLQRVEAARDSLTDAGIIGMDVSVNIDIVREAELDLIIDEANGDYLRVKGGGQLNGGIDQSGKVTLTGSYLLEEGVYSLTFNLIKREFKISQGSTITWTGEPMTAEVNVTAIYIANTAPLDLVLNQLGEAAPNVVNTYKQKLPFEILLTMKGELLKPEITFDIVLPKGNYGVSSDVTSTVETRLAQLRTEPAEMNKQVFALLLLNRFVSENPFQNSAGGGGVSSIARQSASKLLSEQLNNLVGGMIAGFDLNLDINSVEDYTSGELKNRTNLTVGLSKRLLSDRLSVSIGSNFELEGAQETNRKTTTIAGNVTAEYQLTKDGRYLLRAYRKDEYIVVQGQVVETGVGFVISADYDRFKDIFARRSEEDKDFKRIEREARMEGQKAEIKEGTGEVEKKNE